MQKTLVTTLTTLAGVTLALPATADQAPATPATAAAPATSTTSTTSAVRATSAVPSSPASAARPATSTQPAASTAAAASTAPRTSAVATAAGRPAAAAPALSWGAAASPVMRPARAVRYWTAGKQAKAKAADLPESGPRTGAIPKAGTGASAPRTVPSAKRLTPGGDANGYARVPRPYTGAPHSRISGRLFFVNAAGDGDSCSASVIRSASKLLVVTAAHCVYGVPDGASTGQWHTSFAFVPAYDGRAADVAQREPYGRWGGRRAWKPDKYTGLIGGDWNSIYDIALIEVGGRKRSLQDSVGAFTPMLNQGGRHTIATTGYPGLLGREPYDGRDQLWCVGHTRESRGIPDGDTMLAAGAAAPAVRTGRMETYNCHLFKGHSGGPWILKGTGDLVGVLSAGKEDGEADGNSVANALNLEGYGAIVQQADPNGVYDALSVKLAAQPVRRGGTTTVTATVTMRGLMAAAQVPFSLDLPTGTSLRATSGASCERANRKVGCTIAAVHPGRPVRITARVGVAKDARRSLPFVAHVTSTRLDPAQRDNTAVLRLPVRR
ncbi:trypsin-like peptidase domain-containing protein [Nonomuraea sp. NPDC050643]|uniref:trypsin-like serine peptidase n=1 Tax=Nonomuraea sp. NPDC050643 TaxID=3155660 RepID=UPI0034024539